MPQVTFQLPSVLGPMVGARREVRVEADTLAGALEALVAELPALGTHLFDESGGLRQHVLCLHNGANTRWLDGMDHPVADGDTLTILQAVSGG